MERTPGTLRLISWNVAGRAGDKRNRVAALMDEQPDIVALQEVLAGTVSAYRKRFVEAGLAHVVDSFESAPDPDKLAGPRKYGELIASRWPLEPLPPGSFDIPWPERVLSAIVQPAGIELHVTHIPPGVSNGWTKIETLEGIYRRLQQPSPVPRILCGDFNTPKEELPDGTVTPWGDSERWRSGELSVVVGLSECGFIDAFRHLHGYDVEESSWYWRPKSDGRIGRRYDHVFADATLNPVQCRYLHELRENGLSDHSPIVVDFAPGAEPRQAHSAPGAGEAQRGFVTDIRSSDPDADGRRRARFHRGWRDAAGGRSYAAHTLRQLTWQNLGYRLGCLFGETGDDMIDEAYDWAVRRQAEQQGRQDA